MKLSIPTDTNTSYYHSSRYYLSATSIHTYILYIQKRNKFVSLGSSTIRPIIKLLFVHLHTVYCKYHLQTRFFVVPFKPTSMLTDIDDEAQQKIPNTFFINFYFLFFSFFPTSSNFAYYYSSVNVYGAAHSTHRKLNDLELASLVNIGYTFCLILFFFFTFAAYYHI